MGRRVDQVLRFLQERSLSLSLSQERESIVGSVARSRRESLAK